MKTEVRCTFLTPKPHTMNYSFTTKPEANAWIKNMHGIYGDSIKVEIGKVEKVKKNKDK